MVKSEVVVARESGCAVRGAEVAANVTRCVSSRPGTALPGVSGPAVACACTPAVACACTGAQDRAGAGAGAEDGAEAEAEDGAEGGAEAVDGRRHGQVIEVALA
jgi:hypothetical protein